jgi:hypothetical protein
MPQFPIANSSPGFQLSRAMRSTLCFLITVLACAPLLAQEPAKPEHKAIVEKIDLKDRRHARLPRRLDHAPVPLHAIRRGLFLHALSEAAAALSQCGVGGDRAKECARSLR